MTDGNKPKNERSPEISSTHDGIEGQEGSCPNFDAPAFLDDEGPSDVIPQGIYVTVRDE